MSVELHTSCRICAGHCGLILVRDEAGNAHSLRGDQDNPVTRGYACIKGLTLLEANASPDRLLHPLKRQSDGSFRKIRLVQALDEIASEIGTIAGRLGPHAIAGFKGTMGYGNVLANMMMLERFRALGSRSFFSTMTIDQSAKWVTVERLGAWAAGRAPMKGADVVMMVGTNPLISLSTFNFINQNPVKAIKDARAAGMTIIVIDPRETETARFADLHLRPLPGEDAILMAAILQVILAQGWEDRDFCDRFVDGLEALRTALQPFTPEAVASRVGVPADEIRKAAELFAKPFPDRPKTGNIASGTGPNMGYNSNLAEHLIECLNVVCGRYPRAGDRVANPGVTSSRQPRLEQVVPPGRNWEKGWRDSNGFGMLFGERMSATLPDAIRSRGEDRVAALIVDGGNPANAMPGSDAEATFSELDLLIAIDPFLTETSRLAHYILPPTMMFERYDIVSPVYEPHIIQVPYTQYNRPVLTPPAGSELIEDWRVFRELGQRLGLPMMLAGDRIDYDRAELEETMLGRVLRSSAVPFEKITEADKGTLFDVPEQHVEPGSSTARFAVAPADIVRELAEIQGMASRCEPDRAFRLSVRRMREASNTMYHHVPTIKQRVPSNPAWLNPADLRDMEIADGDCIEVHSRHGEIQAIIYLT